MSNTEEKVKFQYIYVINLDLWEPYLKQQIIGASRKMSEVLEKSLWGEGVSGNLINENLWAPNLCLENVKCYSCRAKK